MLPFDWIGYRHDPRANRPPTAFAARIGVPVATLHSWEQGRRRPDILARALLALLPDNPEAFARTLAEATCRTA